MFNPEETQYEVLRRRGICRRDFLKFCSMAAVALGLGPMGHLEIAHAMETKPYLPVLWINGLSCSCCTESFIRSGASFGFRHHPFHDRAGLSGHHHGGCGRSGYGMFRRSHQHLQGTLYPRGGRQSASWRRRHVLHRRRASLHGQTPARSRRSQGHRRVGDLRLMGMRAGCPPQSDSGDPYPQSHSRQADHQGPGLPCHPGRHEQHRRLRPDL